MLFWASLVHFIAFGLLCPILFFWASSARFITFGLLCPIWAALSHFTLLGILDPFHRFQAPLSHLFFLGRPRPVCFPWASSALFLTSHYHGLLLNSLGFPDPITLFLILEVHGLAINPLLSLFSLLWTCCGPFSLFHIIHCLWFAFSLFPSSFKPIYLLKIYFFISWVCDPLFPLLGLNGFSSQFTNFFFYHISGLLLAIGPPYQSGHQHYPHSKGLSMMMMCAPFSSSSFPFLFLGNFLWSWTSTLVPISLCLQQFLYLFLHVFAVTRTHFFAFGGQILFFFFSASTEYVDTFCCSTCTYFSTLMQLLLCFC